MRLRCKSTGVQGEFFKKYRATGVGMMIQVTTDNGRIYYSPESDWKEM